MPFTMTREKVDNYAEKVANREKTRRWHEKKMGRVLSEKEWRPPEFVCVDGEGTGEGDSHKYVLLGVGVNQFEDPDGIGWQDAFDFLYSEFESRPRAVYVGFFLSYDFNQILKTLPQERAAMLMTEKGMVSRRRTGSGGNTVPFPVRHDGWEFDFLPGRRLKIRPEACECSYDPDICTNKHWGTAQKGSREKCFRPHCQHKGKKWMHICDAGAFWQCSLLNVLNPSRWETPICTPEEYETILVNKARRDVAVLDDEMRLYNRLENELFARAMRELAIGFHEIGVNLSPSQWFGPGQAAAAWMRDNGVPKRSELTDIYPYQFSEKEKYPSCLTTIQMITKITKMTKRATIATNPKDRAQTAEANTPTARIPQDGITASVFMEAARESYYGGWFEIFSHGIIPETSYEYDLNSAYPAYIAELPCLLHGTYSQGTSDPAVGNDSDLVLVRVTATASNGVVGAMPHRTHDGHILRPNVTTGWHWLSEVRAGISCGIIQEVTYHEWCKYSPCDCMPPAREVSNLYQCRLAVGKNSVLGIAAKLVYNSMYGKFAQAIGQSPYGNWVYASRITSGCREAILKAIGTHPGGLDALLMVATDGVFFDGPHPSLPLSNRLGEWEETTRSYLTQFKPGVYWDQSTRDAIKADKPVKFKARGVSAVAFSKQLEYIDRQYYNWQEGASIPESRTDIYSGDEIILEAQAEKGWPSVVFQVGFNMTSIIQAIQRSDWNQAGQVRSNMYVEQSSMPYEKRCQPYWDVERCRLRSRPRDLTVTDTTPYDKAYGDETPFTWRASELKGVHPDGPGEMPTMHFWNEMVRNRGKK